MSNAQPCMILDDDELEKVGHSRTVREWRRTPEDLGAALRGFRSETAVAGSPPRQFPTAFQTYKPEKTVGAAGNRSGFPFQQTTPPLQGRKPSATASPELTPAGAAPRGTLFQAVRRVFYNSEKGESPPAPAVPPPLVLNESEPEDYPYAQCTPPAQEAPPPGYSPKTPPWWPEAGAAENVPLIQENGGGQSS